MSIWRRGGRFSQQPHARAKGKVGEDAAERWLRSKKYRIIARNVSNRAGEVDVVAMDGDTLCFIEIKARANKSFGGAIEAVTPRKQRQVARTAALYLVAHPFEGPCRFDVLAMDLENGQWRFILVRDAFSMPQSTNRY